MKLMKNLFIFFITFSFVATLCHAEEKTDFLNLLRDQKLTAQSLQAKEDFLLLPSEIKHYLAESSTLSEAKKAIIAYQKALQEKKVLLLLAFVPPKIGLYPQAISPSCPADEIAPSPHNRFLEELRKSGLPILDLYSFFSDLKKNKLPVYCKTDSHWTPLAAQALAEKIAAEIKKSPWYSKIPQQTFSSEKPKNISIKGDLVLPPISENTRENITITRVGKPGEAGKIIPVPPDENSPVVLIGDSHTLVFSEGGEMHCRGAGFVDHLQKSLGFPVARFASKASGSDTARLNFFRKASADPSYLKNKKIVVWLFSERELTQAPRWRTIPIERPAKN